MAKKYFNNYRLELAYDFFFNRNLAIESIAIHDAVDITSGENLPKSKMTEGPYVVYGGGGETLDTHISFNIDYDTIGIGRVGARCGCVFSIKRNSWVTDNALVIKSCDPRFSFQFLRHFLSFKNLGQFANDAMQPVISKTRISGIKVPLLSLKEQQSIAEILDLIEFNKQVPNSFSDQLYLKLKVVDDWENLSSEITNQKQLLSQLKQAILQEAIQGKLTADWRVQNPDVESAYELLKRIKAEKEKLVKEKKIKKEKPLPPIKADEIPFELPEGWVWCRLGELFTSLQYGTSLKCSYSTEQNTPILRIPNVSSGFVSTTDLKFTNLSDKEKDQYSLQEGDLLIIRSNGSREITGSAVWVPKGFESYGYAGYLIRVRFLNEFIHTQYIQKYFCSTTLRVQIEAPLRTTVGINNINTTELSRLIIALPTLEEQDVIYSKVEKLFQKCQIFESQIAQSETHAQMLMQAVLKEAFEPTAATEPESEETIAIAAEPAEAFGKQGEFGF